jgi:hypothetical protein
VQGQAGSAPAQRYVLYRIAGVLWAIRTLPNGKVRVDGNTAVTGQRESRSISKNRDPPIGETESMPESYVPLSR